jgi:single-strand DNA-binding protein
MLNQVQIIGRVGVDPEVRYLTNGDPVVSLRIATSKSWKDKQTGEKKEHTEWHRVNMFGKLAEIVREYVEKGALIFVQGELKTREWTDKDGVKKYSTEIFADTMKMLGSKSNHQPSSGQQQRSNKGSGFDDMNDDIPF